jgi:hypothetical protein
METFKKFNKELPLHVEIDEDGRVNIINKNNEKILSGSNNPCYYETEYNYATSIVEIINTFEKDFENKQKYDWLQDLKFNPDLTQFEKLLEFCTELFYENHVLNNQIESLIHSLVVNITEDKRLKKLTEEDKNKFKRVKIGNKECIAINVDALKSEEQNCFLVYWK